MLAGLAFLPMLSIQLKPSHYLPSVTISYYWQNASPDIIEQEVTGKLEAALSVMRGIEKIKSVSSKGNASITINFDKYADMDMVRFEVASIIRQSYPNLPQQVSYPKISMNKPDGEEDKPLISYTLNGPLTPWYLQQYANNNISKKLSLIAGVDKIEVYGASPMEWQINYYPGILKTIELKPEEISGAIRNYFTQQSVGFGFEKIAGNKYYYSIKLQSKTDSLNWSLIPIKKTGKRIIYLTDVAEIKKKESEPSSYFRINGLNTVNLVVYPEKGVNNLVVAKKVKEAVQYMEQSLPVGYELFTNYDSTEYIQAELTKIGWRTIFTIVILLLFVLLISLSFRYLLIILISLVANISICFILYYFFGVEIHLYSLAGITISLGLIIDNTIVMTDHIRHQQNRKVFLALLASTLTTIAALSFIVFLPDKLKLNLWDFAIIIVINLSVSLIISLFFIPALLDYINIKPRKQKYLLRRRKLIVNLSRFYEKTILFLIRFRKLALISIILILGLPVFMLPNKVDKEVWYSTAYNKTLGNDWYIENLRSWVNKTMGGSLRLFVYYVYDGSYYSEPEQTALYVSASLPKGSTIHQMNDVYLHLEGYLSQFDGIDKYITRVYSAQNGRMEIYFKDGYGESSFPYILKSRLIARSLDLGGVSWNIYGVGKGFSNQTGTAETANYKVAMYGYNYDELYRQANKFKEKLLNHPRIKEVNVAGWRYWWEQEKSYHYVLNLDKEGIASKKTNLRDLYSQFRRFNTAQGLPISVTVNNKLENINIRPQAYASMDLWHIFNTPLGQSGIKFRDFSTLTKEIENQSIYKEDQNYLRIINYNYLGSYKFGNKYLNKVLDEMKEEMPLGYKAKKLSWSFFGDGEKKQYALLLLIVAMIFIISAILFESLKQPLSIIAVIPFSFTGIFLVFYWFDFNFDQGGYASFILLTGLTVNSAIYIINEFNNLKKKYKGRKMPIVKIYLKAFNNKIVPIMLTILSTILGLVPFVVYGQNDVFWFALAIGSIGGLLFSLVVIVFYLPLFVISKHRKR
jgi:multidrug efflux pump subunit AcrB